MRLRLTEGKLIALRTIVAAGFVGAVLFTLVLCALPQLHERIHQTNSANHECVVTLLTSGNYQHAPVTSIALVPPPPPRAFAHASVCFQLVGARLEFSLLEHAPPAIS